MPGEVDLRMDGRKYVFCSPEDALDTQKAFMEGPSNPQKLFVVPWLQQAEYDKLDAIDTSSCCWSFFSDCLTGLWRFLGWLFSCCGISSSEPSVLPQKAPESEPAPVAASPPPPEPPLESKSPIAPLKPKTVPVSIAAYQGKSAVAGAADIPRWYALGSLVDAQKRWKTLAIKTNSVVVLALQTKLDQKTIRWVMQTGIQGKAPEHLHNAFHLFYVYVLQSSIQLKTAQFEYTLAIFYPNGTSKPDNQKYDCYLDASGRKAPEIVKELAIKEHKFPKAVKKKTLLQDRLLVNSLVAKNTLAELVDRDILSLNIVRSKGFRDPTVFLKTFDVKKQLS